MIKIFSVVGARPNFMKIAPIDRALAARADRYEHKIVHTGQHYDEKMSDAFFRDLKLPEPSFYLGVGSGTHAVQTAKIMVEFEKICFEEKPDLVMVAGDVNSTIACGITAVKCGIKLAHIESGLRSFDRAMPEEINRIVTDSISDYCFVTEKSGLENLKRDGFPEERIFFVGNTMIDSLVYALEAAKSSDATRRFGLEPGKFALVTLHRPSNVDEKEQVSMLFDILKEIGESRDVVVPLHPRTRNNLKNFGILGDIGRTKSIKLIEPQGYIDFLKLMTDCDFVMTDSGGIQEETTYLGKTCLTLRTTTERPSTCEIGTNYLVPPEKGPILERARAILAGDRKTGEIPPLWDGAAAGRIVQALDKIFK
ncbi:MAG: non-hydrolyzing UDP-N-acetylglucosamine 2-epimerase [Chloroflexota bacterium]